MSSTGTNFPGSLEVDTGEAKVVTRPAHPRAKSSFMAVGTMMRPIVKLYNRYRDCHSHDREAGVIMIIVVLCTKQSLYGDRPTNDVMFISFQSPLLFLPPNNRESHSSGILPAI